MEQLPKIIVIVGATSSGKTAMSLELARDFNGEIVSADSRQLYKKMDVGTSKPLGEWKRLEGREAYVVEKIPHYMMDIVDPGYELSLAEYKKQAMEHIDDILFRGKIPFVVGGTGLYIWALLDNLDIPAVAPNKKLRTSLLEKPAEELVQLLNTLDPEAHKYIDIKNPRRVIRALEVAILSGEPYYTQRKKAAPRYEALQLGIRRESDELHTRIDATIESQIERGLVAETDALIKQKYGWQLPSMSSIGYRQIREYLEGGLTLEQAVEQIKRETYQYAKRQVTWFKRDPRINWLEGSDVKRARVLIQQFLGH